MKEFFRVRFLVDTIYLLDYNRDMEQIFQGTASEFDDNGILFGITSQDDIQYEINRDETIVAFVQERNLWLYNGEADELTEVFSFSDQEGRDMRSRNDQHAVRIISMDDDGNLAFAVYGYMNRGYHEGDSRSRESIISVWTQMPSKRKHLYQVPSPMRSRQMKLGKMDVLQSRPVHALCAC